MNLTRYVWYFHSNKDLSQVNDKLSELAEQLPPEVLMNKGTGGRDIHGIENIF